MTHTSPSRTDLRVLRISAAPNKAFVDFQELWNYRDLVLLFVRRDFLAKYAQTVLGPAWFILQPLLTSVAFTVIFGEVAKISSDGLPRLLFYLCALLPWGYFSHTMGATGTTYTVNRAIFTKVYFPRLAVPLASLISNLIALGVQLLTFLGFWLFFKFFTTQGDQFHVTSTVWLLPLLTIYTGLIGIGAGLWIAVITAKYRDLQHALPFVTQLWMYGTPIIYSLGMVENPLLRWILSWNPVTAVTELYRLALLGKSAIAPWEIGQSMIVTIVLLLSGLYVFNRIDRTVVDTI